MADAVASQTIIDGMKNLVMKFTNISDGTGEAAVAKISPASLAKFPDGGSGKACTAVIINKIQYTTDGMRVDILWDATTDVLAYSLPTDMQGELDFSQFGGLINNSGTGKTGNVLFTTTGHSSGDRYDIVISATKVY